ncbi:MAG: AAA family ATPase [Blastocatellia bacterium]
MTQSLTFVILADGPGLSQELRNALASDRRARVVAESDNTEQVYEAVVRWRPSAVIIPLGAQPEQAWALCRQINAVCPETVIICAVQGSSSDLILDSLRSGAREFLRLPINAEELKTVLDRAAEFCAGHSQSSKKRGRVIAVFSNKGGCGVSFIAANLAIALGAPTVLVDLNLQMGGLELFFGLKPKFSIVDLVKNRARLDDRLLASFLTPYSDNLSLLASPPDAEAAEDMRPDDAVEVIDILRERYDHVVLDLPHTFDAITIAALDYADEILLALTLDILAARAAQRALAIFGRLGYPRQKVRLVLNRWSKQPDLELRYIERYLGDRVTSFISDDYRAVVNSINLGQPLIASSASSTIVAELKRLAAVCGAAPAETDGAKRTGILRALFRRQTGTLEVEPRYDFLKSPELEPKDK